MIPTTELREQRLGGLRWIVVSGPGEECFHALGEHMRAEIVDAVTNWPVMDRLRRHVATEPGGRRLASVRAATEAAHGREWAELAALAGGAGVAMDDLALLNFRGDLGAVEGGFACSDLAWRRGHSFIAHNEDQSAAMAEQCALLTLAIDGLPRVCAFWCPMFLPSNAFTITGDGLVWSIDSLTVPEPGDGAGRHFVARGLQREARTLDEAIEYLRTHACASGFAYTVGGQTGRVTGVEAVKGRLHVTEVAGALFWHTNHGRFLPGTETKPGGDSERRGELLAGARPGDGEPDAAWFLRLLAGGALPSGVRADPGPGHDAATVCTLVADLTGNEAVIATRAEPLVAIPLPDLPAGTATAQRILPGPGLPAFRNDPASGYSAESAGSE
jgi:hypothetical protein